MTHEGRKCDQETYSYQSQSSLVHVELHGNYEFDKHYLSLSRALILAVKFNDALKIEILYSLATRLGDKCFSTYIR